MSVDEPSSPGDVPPPVDLAGHVRDIVRALVPALLIAVLVGGTVFAVRTLLVPKEYQASVIAQITPAQTLIPGDAFIEQMRAPFVGLAGDSDVLSQVLWEVDTDWDAEELRQHVELTPGESPALLVFTATAYSPESAAQLARAMLINVARKAAANHATEVARQLEGVQAAIAAEQARNGGLAPEDPSKARSDERLAELQGNLGALQNSSSDQLTVLSSPEQSLEPVAPQPVAEALVAAIAALIIAAELIVFFRGRSGSRPNRVWARQSAQRNRAQFGIGDPDMGGLSPGAVALLVRGGHTKRRALILCGDKAVAPDWRPQGSTDQGGAAPASQRALLTDKWWRALSDDAVVVVVVSTAGSDRKLAERALHQLREMALPTSLVLQVNRKRRGKLSRKSTHPAHGKAERHAE